MGIALPVLTPAQESLLLTLGGRAMDSRLPRPLLGDATADEILGLTGYDISQFRGLRPTLSKVFDIALRTKRLDEVVRRFVDTHPDAVVLDLGAGLDTRIMRVAPPPTVSWYDIDFPVVVGLRQQVLPPSVSAHSLGADLTDPHWINDIPADRPTVIVADGLIGFLPQDTLVSLLKQLTSYFPSGELAFNNYTTYAVWAVKHMPSTAAIADGVVNPGFNDSRAPERWAARLRLVEEIFLTRAPEIAQCPPLARLGIRLTGRSAALSRIIGTVILRYAF